MAEFPPLSPAAPPPRRPRHGHLALRLPAALAWIGPADGPEPPALPGCRRLGPRLFAALPAPGDGAIVDAAVAACRNLFGGGGTPWSALVLVADVEVDPERAVPLPDPLLEALAARPPGLAPGQIALTARAGHGLEAGCELAPVAPYEAASGQRFPLFRLGEPRPPSAPFHNPDLLGRRLRWVPRPDAERRLATALRDAPVVALTGPLGVGKSRLAWETLRTGGDLALWATTRPARTAGAGVAAELGRQLAALGIARPEGLAAVVRELAALAVSGLRPTVVLDGLEAADEEAWESARELADWAGRQPGTHLLLLGRPATAWPGALLPAPPVSLGPLDDEAEPPFAAQAVAGLSLPPEVEERLRRAAAGNPYALEEGVAQLATRRQLRQVYGSFFFAGEADAGYEPSARLVARLEAEAARLADPLPLRLLAAAGSPLPAVVAAEVASQTGPPTPPWWGRPYVAGGWLEAAFGPWGEGLRFVCPAWGAAIAASLSPVSRLAARRAVGGRLAATETAGATHWPTYRLLAGSLAGARRLAELARAAGAPGDRQELFAALRAEVAALAEAGGEEELQLSLLWALLPLARRLGRLREVEAELDRALELAAGETERFLALAALRAELAQNAGRPREAESLLRQALAASRDRDDRRKGLLVLDLGRVLLRQGRRDEARELLERALPALAAAGRAGQAAHCQFLLGNLALQENRLADADRLHRAALEVRRAAGATASTVASLCALGAVRMAEGDFPRALVHFREAAESAGAEGSEGEDSFPLLGLGRALARLGDPTSATAPLRRALALRQGHDDRLGEAIARLAVAENHLDLGQLDEALREARRAHFDLALLPEGDARAEAEHLLGRIQLALRRPEEAERHLAEAERLHRQRGHALAAARDLTRRLEAALLAGQPEPIVRHAGALERFLAPFGDRPPADELFDFALYRAALWRQQRGVAGPEPLHHLERAYRELMRQTAFLEPAARHHFLFGIARHRELLETATREGIATRSGSGS